MKILAVVGQPASGKDTVADYLAIKGFHQHIVAFIDAGVVHRTTGYLAEDIADTITGDTVVSGFRNTAEIEIFRRRFDKNFKLIAVESSEQARYERIHSRNREGDDLTFEQFQAEELAEKAKNTGSHEVDKVIALADVALQNDGTKDELLEKVDLFLNNTNH